MLLLIFFRLFYRIPSSSFILNGTFYFSSIGDGLYDASSQEILVDIPSSAINEDTLLTSLSVGNQLWVSGVGSQPIHAKNISGDWESYVSTSVFNEEFLKVATSFTGVVWALASNGHITIIDGDQIDLISTRRDTRRNHRFRFEH